MMGPESQSDAVDSNVTLQTQAQILQSDSLALQVVRELNLEGTPTFAPTSTQSAGSLAWFTPSGMPDPQNVPLEQAPGRRAKVIKMFESHLKVKPVSGTRLINVEYLSSIPDRRCGGKPAGAGPGRIQFSDPSQRHPRSQRMAGKPTGRSAQAERRSAGQSRRPAARLGRVRVWSDRHPGHEQVFTPALDRLQQATTQLEQAQAARIMKGALYQVVKKGDPELISGLAGNGMLSGASPSVTGSLTLLQNLRSEEAQTQAKLNELSAKFGPGYPKLAELQSSLDSTRKSIRAEAARIASRVQNDYNVAQQIEDKDRAVFLDEKSKAEVAKRQSRSIPDCPAGSDAKPDSL